MKKSRSTLYAWMRIHGLKSEYVDADCCNPYPYWMVWKPGFPSIYGSGATIISALTEVAGLLNVELPDSENVQGSLTRKNTGAIDARRGLLSPPKTEAGSSPAFGMPKRTPSESWSMICLILGCNSEKGWNTEWGDKCKRCGKTIEPNY